MRRIGGRITVLTALSVLSGFFLPDSAMAIQMHRGSEGIIVHQVGHLVFFLSMVMLVFIVQERELNQKKGWRMIQYSAVLFAIWNLDTIAAHFIDNQVQIVTVEKLSLWQVKLSSVSGSRFLVLLYHSLKLDHFLCVPALFLFYRGLATLLAQEKAASNTAQAGQVRKGEKEG